MCPRLHTRLIGPCKEVLKNISSVFGKVCLSQAWVVRLRPIVCMWNLLLREEYPTWGLSEGSQSVFTRVSEKTAGNSEWLVRQTRGRIESFRLPTFRAKPTRLLVGAIFNSAIPESLKYIYICYQQLMSLMLRF